MALWRWNLKGMTTKIWTSLPKVNKKLVDWSWIFLSVQWYLVLIKNQKNLWSRKAVHPFQLVSFSSHLVPQRIAKKSTQKKKHREQIHLLVVKIINQANEISSALIQLFTAKHARDSSVLVYFSFVFVCSRRILCRVHSLKSFVSTSDTFLQPTLS